MLSLRAQAFSVENLIRPSPPNSCSALDLTSSSVDHQEHTISATATTEPSSTSSTITAVSNVKTRSEPGVPLATVHRSSQQERGHPKKRRRASIDSAEGQVEREGEEVKFPRKSLSEHGRQSVSMVENKPDCSSEYEVVPETTRAKNANTSSSRDIHLAMKSGNDSDSEENARSSDSPIPGSKILVNLTVAPRDGETTPIDLNNNNNNNNNYNNSNKLAKYPDDDSAPMRDENFNSFLKVKRIDHGDLLFLEPHLDHNEGLAFGNQPQFCVAYRQPQKTSLVTQFCFCHGDVPCRGHPGILSVRDCHDHSRELLAELVHADLWSSFHSLGTEMIITKSGRRMFPAFKVRLSGLDPNKLYTVKLDFLQPDSRKYRYIYHSSQWVVSGSGDTLQEPPSYVTQEGPISGKDICYQVVSFERLKLTNVESCRPGQVSLVSMQKFQPRVVVEEHALSSNVLRERFEIIFPQTSFIAVTAYQNQQITTLKIASNPFAKGFRDSGKSRQMLYPPSPSFPLSSPWSCLPMPNVHNIFGFDQKRPPSKDSVDLDICGLENLYKLKKLQRVDNSLMKLEDERALRGKANSYLTNLNNVHGRNLPTAPDIPTLYPVSYKQQKSEQLTQQAQFYQRQQLYVSYHNQAQQILQQQQQYVDKTLMTSVVNSSNAQFNEGSNTAVCNSAFERPSPFGTFRVPPLFYPITSHLYSQDTSNVKETHLSRAPDLPPLLLPFQAHTYQPVTRLSPQLESICDDRIPGLQQETSRHFDSPRQSPDRSPRADSSPKVAKPISLPRAPSVTSSGSPNSSPTQLSHSPL